MVSEKFQFYIERMGMILDANSRFQVHDIEKCIRSAVACDPDISDDECEEIIRSLRDARKLAVKRLMREGK